MNVFNRDILCHENGCPFKIPIVRVNQFYRIPFLIHHRNAHLSSETIELSIHSMVRTRGNRYIKTGVCISCSRTNFKSSILARTQCASWSGEVRVLSILRVRHQCHLVFPKLPIAHKRTRNRSGDGVNIIIAIALTIPTKVGMNEAAAVIAVINECVNTTANHHRVAIGKLLHDCFTKFVCLHAIAVQQASGITKVILQSIEGVFDVGGTGLGAECDANGFTHVYQQTTNSIHRTEVFHLFACVLHCFPKIGGRCVGFVSVTSFADIECWTLFRPFVEIQKLCSSGGYTARVGGLPIDNRGFAIVRITLSPLSCDKRSHIAL